MGLSEGGRLDRKAQVGLSLPPITHRGTGSHLSLSISYKIRQKRAILGSRKKKDGQRRRKRGLGGLKKVRKGLDAKHCMDPLKKIENWEIHITLRKKEYLKETLLGWAPFPQGKSLPQGVVLLQRGVNLI